MFINNIYWYNYGYSVDIGVGNLTYKIGVGIEVILYPLWGIEIDHLVITIPNYYPPR